MKHLAFFTLALAPLTAILYARGMSKSPIIHVMSKAAFAASKGVIRDFGEIDKLQISKKGVANFVTSADLRTEKTILESLNKSRPKMSVLSEEAGFVGDENATERFVVDPIDGTTNFIHAMPYFCISIAAQKRKHDGTWDTYAGIIYDPVHDELFSAEKHKGAFLNSNFRLEVSKRDSEALLATTSPRSYREDYEQTLAAFTRLTGCGFTLRCLGSAALDLAYVAAGRVDGTWYHCLNSWDMAAGALLVQEAGGIVTRETGEPYDAERGSILATNAAVHDQLVGHLNKAMG